MKAGDGRDNMLARVRAALGRATTVPPPLPAVDEAVARLSPVDADAIARFTRNAEHMEMRVHPTRDAAGTVRERLAAHGARRAAAGLLEGMGVEPAPWSKEELFAADAGVVRAQFGLADTGSLVCCAGVDQARGLSLIPPLLVAVLDARDVLPDMIDLWPSLGPQLPGNVVLITGPSKTADIEGALVVGVHGPGVVEIVLVEA